MKKYIFKTCKQLFVTSICATLIFNTNLIKPLANTNNSSNLKVTVASSKKINVFFDSKELHLDVSPVIINGSTFVPMRPIFKLFKMDLSWDDSTKTVTATDEKTTMSLTINHNRYKINGVTKIIENPAIIINGNTMVPLRLITENLGYEISWDAVNNNVLIYSKENPDKSYETLQGSSIFKYNGKPVRVSDSNYVKEGDYIYLNLYGLKQAFPDFDVSNTMENNTDLFKFSVGNKTYLLSLSDDKSMMITGKDELNMRINYKIFNNKFYLNFDELLDSFNSGKRSDGIYSYYTPRATK